MKKYLSIYSLFFRSSARGAGIVILATVLVQGILLWINMKGETLYFENVVSGYIMLPSLIGLVALLWIMRDMLGASRSNVNLTLRRLSVKTIPIFITEAVYFLMLLLVFWAMTAGITYAFAAYFTDNVSVAPNPQIRLLVAAYRCGPLHILFPLGDTLRLVCNVAAIIAFGFSMAAGNYFRRKGRNGDGFAWITLCLFLSLSVRVYNMSIAAVEVIGYGLVIFTAIACIVFEEKNPAEAEKTESEGGEGADEQKKIA